MKIDFPYLMSDDSYRLKWLVLFVSLAWLLQWQVTMAHAEQSFKSITGPCQFQFPRDHGPHPGYRTEWWYYTGNLHTEMGERFGFQLTFFRSQMSPPGAEKKWPQSPSAWRTQQLFLAHAALSDIENGRFFDAEQMARGALHMAEARQESDRVFISVKNWSATITLEKHLLVAETPNFRLDLVLKPHKQPTAHGDSGYSLKGLNPESASCYYSMTRLEAGGSLYMNGRKVELKGLAWMDHEYSSAPLEPDLVGWDWFSLQLDNGTELMIYLLRKGNDEYSGASSGTLVKSSGETRYLSREMFQVEILNRWKSPHSQAVYPAGWRIMIPKLQLDLRIAPNLADQEMRTSETTRVTYWEGSVSVEGNLQGERVAGAGYVELTGYDKRFDAPL
ncbi:MAG: lipocalin-like domain-containing protein [Desulforhabdus sp.]|jgi:predicted secreted hydrolase|nr:lipocalin-like domain-containing protein [Desulforhabdus sp.]